MAWWQGSEKLAQGQNRIIKKAILDVQHTPQGGRIQDPSATPLGLMNEGGVLG